jgi:hypothetical protein
MERLAAQGQRSAPAGRLLYLVPLVLLVAAGWTYRSNAVARNATSEAFPLESATDPADPRRYVDLDNGVVLDAATGITLPAQAGRTPAEVFASAQSDGRTRAPVRFDGAIGDDGQATGQATGRGVPSVAASQLPGLPSDLRYGIGPRPSGLTVTGIGVRSEVIPIGLDANRALQVPRRADIVGWWSGGSIPGEIGPTVLVGHYDSRVSSGVFARLKELTIGDLIVVSQSDGAQYTYYVTDVQHLSKTAFPTERVYGRTPGSTLRLVTCGGRFDRRTGHYVDNTIVYAELWSSTPSRWVTTSTIGPEVASADPSGPGVPPLTAWPTPPPPSSSLATSAASTVSSTSSSTTSTSTVVSTSPPPATTVVKRSPSTADPATTTVGPSLTSSTVLAPPSTPATSAPATSAPNPPTSTETPADPQSTSPATSFVGETSTTP